MTKIVSDLPRKARTVEHVWIPMKDGVRLSARLWIPEGAEDDPVPAIFEFIPYRKRDRKRVRDESMHGWFAGHGYACVRVDIRGSGESEGVLEDEYLQSELDDGCAILEWIAEQAWCDGNIGMIGISWGGFNGLQIAAMQPPQLKAVVSVASTDDRYADDIHHMGGCLLGDNLSWASAMFDFNSLPPDPEIVGDAWRDMWMERLEGSGLWLEKWLKHQHRDAYWRHGSICEDYSAVKCPVMAVSGWADGYSNTVLRLMAHLEAPRMGLVGPWSHLYPHIGKPGPAIGFLQECKRWWDQWLKGEETGIMDEPMLRAYMQDSVPPTTSYDEKPGRWVGETEWPSPDIEKMDFMLSRDRLIPVRDEDLVPEKDRHKLQPQPLTIQSPLGVGLFAGKWCSYASAPDLPHDQRQEDGGSLVFETPPLADDLEILGAAEVTLDISANRPVAMVAARISDVHPDGKATRVTYGLLNLTHRESRSRPKKLEPGERYTVTLKLNDVAQRFPKGHRVRLSISSSYFPLAWTPPQPVCLTVHAGESMLSLPARPPKDSDANIAFEEPEMAPGPNITVLDPPYDNWRVIRDLATDVSTLEVIGEGGRLRYDDIDLTAVNNCYEWYRFQADDFNSVSGETLNESACSRGEWEISTRTHMRLTSDERYFFITAEMDAFEGEKRVYSRNWDVRIPRDFV